MVPIIIFWLVSGILAHGIAFAYFQREYESISKMNYWSDFVYSSVIGLVFGPIALLLHLKLFKYLKHGIKFY